MTFKGPLEVGKTYELNDGTEGVCSRSAAGTLIIAGHGYQTNGALIGGDPTGDKAVKRRLDDRPPVGVLIEWDGSEIPPVPVGTDATLLFEYGVWDRRTTDAIDWDKVVSYTVHNYPEEPEEPEGVDCWLEYDVYGHIHSSLNPIPKGQFTKYLVKIRFTDGVAEIVGQKKNFMKDNK